MKIKVSVSEVEALPPHLRKLVAQHAGELIGRIYCDVANALIPAFENAGMPLHSRVRPQVGTKKSDGRKFIMVKLATGEKLTWYEKAAPSIVWTKAKSHDHGRGVKAFVFTLDTDKAEIVRPHAPNPGRHDLDENGERRKRDTPNGNAPTGKREYPRDW